MVDRATAGGSILTRAELSAIISNALLQLTFSKQWMINRDLRELLARNLAITTHLGANPVSSFPLHTQIRSVSIGNGYDNMYIPTLSDGLHSDEAWPFNVLLDVCNWRSRDIRKLMKTLFDRKPSHSNTPWRLTLIAPAKYKPPPE
jgi:hypothetical protein